MPAAPPAAAPPAAPDFHAATASAAPEAPAPGTGGIGSEFLQGLEAGAGGQNVSMLGGAMEAGGVLADKKIPILARALRAGGQKLQDYGTEVTPTPQVGSIADVPGDGVMDTLERFGKLAAFKAGSGIGTSLPSVAIGGAAGLATANPTVGLIAGQVGPSYVQNLGDFYISATNDPEIAAAIKAGTITDEQVAKTAALAAIPIAALDIAGLSKILGPAFKPAKDALRTRILRGIATGAIAEGSTEGLQDVVSQWAQSTLGQHKELGDRVIEVVDNVLGGVFAGGLMGGVAGVGDKPEAAPAPGPRGATPKPGKEGELISPAPAGTPRLADMSRVVEATARGEVIPVQGIVNRSQAKSAGASSPAQLTGENGPTTNIDVEERPNIVTDAARRPRETLATEAGHTLTEQLDQARRNAPPANNIDVQEGADLTGVPGIEHIDAAYPPDGIEVDESPMPKPPAFEPVGAGQGALPANAPKPADWRAKWDTKEVGPGRWRVVGMANGNPISPAFSSKSDAEVWADNQGASTIDAAAHEAATSPQNTIPEPTDSQKEAGNYPMGHTTIGGLDVSIENPEGSVRRAKKDAPVQWETKMRHHYGYFRGTVGMDGDHVDTFIKPGTPENFDGTVFVVDQNHPDGKPDEHKVMLGFGTVDEAKQAYHDNYTKGWKGYGGIVAMPMTDFATWLKDGSTSRPAVEWARGRSASAAPTKNPAREAAKAAPEATPTTPNNGQVRPEVATESSSQARVSTQPTAKPEEKPEAAQQSNPAAAELGGEAKAQPPSQAPAAAPAPAKATTEDAPLTVETYSDKAIIVRGDTRTHKDRIKAIGGALWNKKAGGWIFKAAKRADVENGLADLLGKSPETVPLSVPKNVPENPTPAPQAGPKVVANYDRLRIIAKNIGVAVDEVGTGFHARDGAISIPTEDTSPEMMAAVSAKHIFAHELGHAVMQKRGYSYKGFPVAELRKQIPNWDELVEASKAFRPALWNHSNSKVKLHVRKPNEVIADAIATVLLNDDGDLTLLRDLPLNSYDLGLKASEKPKPNGAAEIGKVVLDRANRELPPGFLIVYEGSGLSLYRDGKPTIAGLSRTVNGVEEAERHARRMAASPTPEPKRKQPGDADYTLLDARNDLIEYRTQLEGRGNAVDDRLAERVRRQEKLVKEMEADEQPAGIEAKWRDSTPAERRELLRAANYKDGDAARVFSGTEWEQLSDIVRRALSAAASTPAEKPATDDDLSAMFDDVLAEELSARGQPPAAKPAQARAKPTIWNKGDGEYIVQVPHRPDDPMGGFQNLGSFTLSKAGAPIGVRYFFEAQETRGLVDEAVDQWRKDNVKRAPKTPQVEPLGGMAPLGAKPPAAPADRTAGQSLASAGKNTAEGLSSAIKGLGELFGGKGGRLNSGLSFDEETYAKAKPLFIQAVRNLKDAASDLREAMRTIIRMVLDQFGVETADGMKPYVVRFVGDVQAGAINLTEGSDDGIQDSLPGSDAAEQPEGVQSPGEDGGAGSAPAGEDGGSLSDAGRAAGGRAARGKRGTTGRSGSARSGTAGTGNADRVAAGNYRIAPGALEESRGPAQKARDNVRAIELARQIEAEGRPATLDEQRELALYVGWGGLSGAFPDGDGNYGKGFETIGPKVRELLNDTEYATAQRSIQYAHYTSEPVIRAMWDLADLLGFKGGKVFEPGMGIGHFAGLMPADIAERTAYNGLELDHTTARIARLLYPKLGVRQDDFTKAPLPDNMNDLVIGNPPFADIVIKSDPKYASHGFLLHDYFFAKSLDAVRPGGLLMFISSAGTMNKNDTAARQYLADRADLVGAIRLPSSAFKANAGTEVTTDIIVMRKRLPGEEPAGQPFVDVTPVTLPDKNGNMKEGNISSYFAAHPEMVLGEQGFFDKLYAGRYAVRPTPGAHLADQLSEAIGRFPEDVMTDWADTHSHDDIDFASEERKEGSYYLDKDGRLMQHHEGVGVPVQKRGKGVEGGKSADELARIKGLVPVRDALRAVYTADLAGDTANADRARERLNKTYDAYVGEFGPINKSDLSYRRPNRIQAESARSEAREEARYGGLEFDEGSFDPSRMIREGKSLAEIAKARADAREAAVAAGEAWSEGTFDPADMPDIVVDKRPNIDPFSDDPESYRLRAIERYNEATGEATKGLVFAESVITKERKPEINSAGDAMLYVLNKHGYPDIDEIALAAKMTRDEVLAQLGGTLFELPGNPGTYETAEDYLSGNVRKKLAEAEAAARDDDRYRKNVQALLAVQPADLPPSMISATLGMPWIPAEDIKQFGAEALGLADLSVSYMPKLAEWVVSGDQKSAAATLTYGTDRVPAPVVLAHALNRVPIKVYDTGKNPDGSTWRELNTTATEGALVKLQEVKDKFAGWVFGDEARAERLATLYNEKYNNLRPWEGDGSYLTTPGVSSEWTWRPHQLRVIARILRKGNTYMGHAVGAGKTSAMIGAGMELRRLGLARKPMYVVPNHMLGQFAKEFYEQYPTAKIMVADERRFHTNRRKQFIADVASQDLDAVIITHSAFGMIPVSSEFQDMVIQEQIDAYREILDELGKKEWGEDSEKRITRKRVENAIEKLEQRLSGRMKGGRKDQVFTFEEMGVDYLFVDEAHLFRKLDFATRMSGVKGISPEGSKASMDLYVKARYLRTLAPTRHMVLASGTPITNTMAELYSVSRYVQEHELEERGLAAFDAWAAAFGDTVTEVEQDASGGYKAQTRFAEFVNVPELSAMVRQVMDVVTGNDLAQYVTRPTIKGGKRQLVLAEKSKALDAYQQGLAARMRAIEDRKGPPKKGDDILLSVINDGRLAAIDMRLVDPSFGRSDPPSKLDMLVNDVFRTWDETKAQPLHKPGPEGYSEKPVDYGPATQMIFANLGIGDGRPFNVAKYIVSELVSRGVPRSEIALIADHGTHVARQKLFNDMNEGKVRVLIGSTAKMATGVNAQRRLFRINNLDPLWYPADDEQRIGRGLRQGNMNPEIEVADYSTKGTYDSQMWNLMAKKARFIEGFFRGDPTLRTMEDLGESSQYEQAKAMTTNDPRLIELTNLKQDLQRAERRKDAFESETYNAKRRVARAQAAITAENEQIALVKNYIERRIDTAGDNFFGQLGETLYKDRAEFGKAMWDLRKEMTDAQKIVKRQRVGDFGGFTIIATVDSHRQAMKGEDGEPLRTSSNHFIYEDAFQATLALELDKNNEIVARGNGALALVNSFEQSLADFEGRVNRARRAIADAEKDVAEFTPRMEKKFDGQAAVDELRDKLNALERTLAEESAAARAALQAQTAEVEPDGPAEAGPMYAARQSTGAPERGLSASGLHDYLAKRVGGQAIRNLLRTGKLKIVAASDPSLPQDAKEAMRDGRRIYGLYDEPSDTTFLIHDNLTDAGQRVGDLEDGFAIFLHEMGVHYGMPDFLGHDHFKTITKQLRLAAKANSSELGIAARAAYAQVPASTRADRIDEEALAWLVTDRANHKLGLVKRILMKIRAWLVKHGFKNVTSPDELVELARGAVNHAAGERLRTNGGARYAARDVTGTEAFKRWFGDSKAVDETGRPLRLYHGTTASFDEFNPNMNPFERGVFLTPDPAMAGFFTLGGSGRVTNGGNILPLYARLANPMVVDFQGQNFPYRTGVGDILESARAAGHDGLILKNVVEGESFDIADGASKSGEGIDQYVVFNPEQVKSATGNSGAFDPSNPSVLYAARDRSQPVEDQPALEQGLIDRARQRFEPWLDAFRYEAQDKFHYLNKAQKEAAAERGLPELPENEDAYLAELRYHGMAGAAIEDFQRDHVDPMLKAIKDAGLDIDRVDEFLHARHAKEANAQLRKINPTEDELEQRIAEAAESGDFVLASRLANHKPYEGDNSALSGMSDAEARAVMAKARADGKFDALEDIGRRVDEITAARRDLLVSSGLEKRGTIAAWENAYQHYVPLKREGKGDALPRRGKGYDTRGKEKRRAGSNRAVEHILANVVAQHEATLMRAEKAKVGRAMMTFALKNPNPDLYEVNKVDYQPTFDAQGLVTYRAAPGFVMADNVFVVRVKGQDHRITFNEANPDAMKIASAIKNLGAEESGPIVNVLSKFTRILSLVNTGANPEFIISNFARDIQTAGYNLSGTEADALKWQIIGDVGKAWAGIRKFQKNKGGVWADHFDAFRKAGGQTGWMDHYKDIGDREKALINKVRDMEGGAWPTVKRGLKAIDKFIEDENAAVENAIRLSAFVHAREAGLSDAKAARLAKELTVNFNRRGAMGKTLNALYLFYNASIQGQVRIVQAIAKSRKVQGLVVATVIGATLLDMWNRAVGDDDDDDKPNPYDSEAMRYVKGRNLVVMLPGGDYIKIPLPWGYNVFHVMGQSLGEMLTKPGASATGAAARVAGAVVDAFNPIGGSASPLQMISPTIVDPVAQWYENKDFAGRPLRPSGNPFGPEKPESQKYWSSVRPYSKWITDTLNTLTGGDEVRPGAIDFSPEAIDLVIDTFTGGAGRFVADTIGAPWKKFVQGEPIETYEVPLLRKVYGTPGTAQTTQDYYKNRDAIALTQAQLSHYKTDGVKLREVRAQHAADLRMIPALKSTEAQLKKLREARKLSKDRAREREIEDRMHQVMDRFNDRYYKVVTRAAD